MLKILVAADAATGRGSRRDYVHERFCKMDDESEYYICLWKSKSGRYAANADAANREIIRMGVTYFPRDCRFELRHASLNFALHVMGYLSHDAAIDLYVSVEPYKILAE